MTKKPDVLCLGFVDVTEEELVSCYQNDNWRLLNDMFEKHDGELAVITREIMNEVVGTPQLPWLMESRTCFFPKVVCNTPNHKTR